MGSGLQIVEQSIGFGNAREFDDFARIAQQDPAALN
jgi:hypothetical protein